MPVYEYVCKDCEHKFEELYTTFDKAKLEEPELKCPKCDSVNKSRTINQGTSFILKGRGWAKDRYR